MSLEINPKLENRLRHQATRFGLTIEQLLERVLPTQGLQFAPDTSKNERERVQALIAEWQHQDQTPVLSTPVREGLTPTQALFKVWEEEDATLTPEEIAEELRFWGEFQHSLDTERSSAGRTAIF